MKVWAKISKKKSKAIIPNCFNDEWLQLDKFKDCLRMVNDEANCWCMYNLLSSSSKAILNEFAGGVQYEEIVSVVCVIENSW